MKSNQVKKTQKPGAIIEDLTEMCNPVRRLVVVGKDGFTQQGALGSMTRNVCPDGIEIIGNGTLQHPMDIRMSPLYQSAPNLLKALLLTRKRMKQLLEFEDMDSELAFKILYGDNEINNAIKEAERKYA